MEGSFSSYPFVMEFCLARIRDLCMLYMGACVAARPMPGLLCMLRIHMYTYLSVLHR